VSPFVRIILINYDGGQVTMRCLESLVQLDYPDERYEIVMVDNASIDGLMWSVRRRFPHVRIIESLTNEGFARGNNLAFKDLQGVDIVALINNDTIVRPDWLTALVEPFSSDSRIGVTASKLLFNREVVGVHVVPTKESIHLSGVRLNGHDAWNEAVFDEKWSPVRHPPSCGSQPQNATLQSIRGASFTITRGRGQFPCTLSLLLSSGSPTDAEIIGPGLQTSVRVEPKAKWINFVIENHGYAINGAGSGIFEGLHGGDVGFKELDIGQFDEPRDVFAFCGGAAAIRSEVLRDVGHFDPTYFLYYEDLDLSWRAHYQGWRIRYVPSSVVLHEHAYSSGEWSPFFRFWVDRNRRLTLIKNAPASIALKAFAGAIVWGIRDSCLPVARSICRLQRPRWQQSKHRLRQMGSFMKAVPAAYRFRRSQLRKSAVRPEFVFDWISTRFENEVGQSKMREGLDV
jgi:GT2 family glycosyltransferase